MSARATQAHYKPDASSLILLKDDKVTTVKEKKAASHIPFYDEV